MGRTLAMIKGLGLGAGLLYLFDPDVGPRRRARLRDQLDHRVHELDDFLGKASRDLRNRASGVVSELGSWFAAERPDDRLLIERVRAKLGHVVSHPRAIVVTADRGRVTLRGPILAREVEPLCRAVASVRGVSAVENRLEVHDAAGGISSLQGGVPRPADSRLHWTPGTQLVVAAAGGILALKIARRGGLAALAVASLGLGLAASGLGDQPRCQRRDRGAGRGASSGLQRSMTSARL